MSTPLGAEAVEDLRALGVPVIDEGGMGKGSYVAEVYCGNCDYGSAFAPEAMVLPRGHPVAEVPCPGCGIRLLRRPPEALRKHKRKDADDDT